MDLGLVVNIFRLLLVTTVLTLVSFADTFKHPFLWKVEKGGKTTAYLFGTMHIPSPELSILPPVVVSTLNNSDAIYTEIDMNFMNQLTITTLMLRKDGKPLKEILSKALYRRTENYLKTISPVLTLEPFNQMKIWSLSATIGLLENQLKNMGLRAIDDIIFSYGKEHNKRVGGVESIEEQVGYFNNFTLSEQILMLESTLDYLETHSHYTERMKQLYLAGDGSKLIAFTNEQFQDKKYLKLEEKFMKILLYQRNRVMAQRIDKLLKKYPKEQQLFAFGVMHFLDKKSVISNLEKMGYQVSRVNLSTKN